MDRLEEQGIVSAADHIGKREVATVDTIRTAIALQAAIPEDADRATIVEALVGASDDIAAKALKSVHKSSEKAKASPL
ncbi:hypothetical protein [Pseudophaeobacter sp.]|uniref:hypothetical protein n=1 Tax=Pseudophaeobacter sp. TaxID=1971739 RepID=UPI00263400A6|nr:hypothetical protein [Pseudophaeobacter sp.]